MTEALRYDQGKPELHHIHPHAWQLMLRTHCFRDSELLRFSNAMDAWFYRKCGGPLLREWRIVDSDTLTEVSSVLTFGAAKYAPLNYAKGMAFSRVLNSFRRHALAVVGDNPLDTESGLSHMAHALCNVLFAVTYTLTGVGHDDRPEVLK